MDFSALRAPPAEIYKLPDPLPWDRLIGPMARAEDALARLDERLRRSPVREGFASRGDFADACASLWLDGELVHVEDLVLHNARMDVRAPTAELVRAHAVLRARRRVAQAEPEWSQTNAGLDLLRGRSGSTTAVQTGIAVDQDWEDPDNETEDEWSRALAAVDTVVARAEKLLAGERLERRSGDDRSDLVYDLDWDEDERLEHWRRIVRETRRLPPTLAAAVALDAWNEIDPLQSQGWLGRLLVAGLLRSRGKAHSHLPANSLGLKATPQERRWKRDPVLRLEVALESIALGAEAGLKEHDRLVNARERLMRRVGGRRTSSSLPALVELALATPIVTTSLIANRLKVTTRAATMLATELELRETTGRKRYRAWSAI